MRDYAMMRDILVFISKGGRRTLNDFCHFGTADNVKCELARLRDEGLIVSDMRFEAEYNGGGVDGLTADGTAFLRNIEDDRVWSLIRRTLEGTGLDLSYPLLKKVCETIVERYVMSRIPKEF